MSPRSSLAGIVTFLVAVCGPGALNAEENRSGLAWLSGEAIREAFAGQALGGIYPDDRTWSEAIKTDGQTDYSEGRKRWQGRWWVTAREFCFAYPLPGVGGCFRVTRISANCFELYDFSGNPAQAEEPPNIADIWNGRMWIAKIPTTCEDRPSS